MSADAFKRASKRAPCPICGRKKYCVLIDDGRLALCTKAEAGSIKPSSNGSGWIHVVRDEPGRERMPRAPARGEAPPPDLRPLVTGAVAGTPTSWLEDLARSLHLPASGAGALRRLEAHRTCYSAEHVLRVAPRDVDRAQSLRRFVGWIASGNVAAFPMSARDRVTGIRTRDTASGKKLALPGGREGVFLPVGLRPALDLLAIVEGPTDCAALLSIGVETIGRPNCSGGVDECLRLALVLKPQAIALVLDRDAPGIRGGVALARRLADIVADVRCVLPPVKDARAWIAGGATRDHILQAIARGRRVHRGSDA